MATVTLKGNPINTIGELPSIGEKAKGFTLTKGDLSKVSLNDFARSRIILNIFPSIDTGTCAQSVRYFNASANDLENTKILCISRDLPFAQSRFCGTEGLENVVTLSDYATGHFGDDYGVTFVDGPLSHLHSRAVIILDEGGEVIYTEQIPEIVDEPDYEKALKLLR